MKVMEFYQVDVKTIQN